MKGFGRKPYLRPGRSDWPAKPQSPWRRMPDGSQRPIRKRRRSFSTLGFITTFVFAAAVLTVLHPNLWSRFGQPKVAELVALYPAHSRNVRHVLQESGPDRSVRAPSRAMPICRGGVRQNCVVDGDTFWLDGEKIRIEGIDAPEVKGKCRHELDLAAKATKRLSSLLSHQTIEIDRNGKDGFGRTLVQVSTGRGEIGSVMIREGLAREYAGGRGSWCGA
jgi:micrococcal nuclease